MVQAPGQLRFRDSCEVGAALGIKGKRGDDIGFVWNAGGDERSKVADLLKRFSVKVAFLGGRLVSVALADPAPSLLVVAGDALAPDP